jgi:hypothetical protein
MQYGSPWPLEADGQDDIGVVVDAQCGYDILIPILCGN